MERKCGRYIRVGFHVLLPGYITSSPPHLHNWESVHTQPVVQRVVKYDNGNV